MHNPAVRDAVDVLGSLAAVLLQRLRLFDERPEALLQIGCHGRPVIHFVVDIRRILAAPCRIAEFVPDALQIHRFRVTGGRNHHIAAVLEQHLDELRVIASAEGRDPVRNRLVALCGVAAEIDVHAAEQRLIIREMRFQQFGIGFLRRLCDIRRGIALFVAVAGCIIHIIRPDGCENRHGIRIGNADAVVHGRDSSLFRNHLCPRRKPHCIGHSVFGIAVPVHDNGIIAVGLNSELILQRAVIGRAERDTARRFAADPRDHHLIRIADKGFALVLLAAAGIGSAGDRSVHIEPARIATGIAVTEIHIQRTDGLIFRLAAADHVRADRAVRILVIAGLHLAPAALHQLFRYIFVVIAGSAAPEGRLIEIKALRGAVAVDHGADPAVSDRQRLVKRFVIVPCIAGIVVSGACGIMQNEIRISGRSLYRTAY